MTDGLLLLRSAAALLVLNAVLTAEIPFARMEGCSLLRISPDGLCLLFGMCLLVRPGQRFRPAVYAVITLTVVILRVFHSADRLVPMVFNRDFNLFLDSQRLPDLFQLVRMTRSAQTVMLATAGILGALTAITWAVWKALKALHHGLASHSPSHRVVRIPAVALSLAVLFAATIDSQASWAGRALLPRLAEEVRFILKLDDIRVHFQSSLQQSMARARHSGGNLEKLDRASVFLIVVESYGMSAFSDPRHSGAVLPAIRAAEVALRSAGFDMCSAYLTSPTFGGGSWLAHATLASGVRIDSQIGHDLLLASNLVPLADYFNRAGYRTVRAMPGTLWPWPEGAFYRYGRSLIAPDFGYRGPAFGFAPMPDQFVLNWIARHIIRNESHPLFVEAILTGSHAAFDIQAPYINDWDAIGDGSEFQVLAPVVFPIDWSNLSEASQGYSAAIVGEIHLLTEFILRFLTGSELVIVAGDHQPALELVGNDQPWSVPVHVISGKPEFIQVLRHRGYTPGLIPLQNQPHPGMETLFWDVLEGFSAG
jgi:hypothetical protein